jgi:hypothetical protein
VVLHDLESTAAARSFPPCFTTTSPTKKKKRRFFGSSLLFFGFDFTFFVSFFAVCVDLRSVHTECSRPKKTVQLTKQNNIGIFSVIGRP